MEGKASSWILKGPNHQEGAKARAADADPKHVGEALPRAIADGSRENVATEGLNAIDFSLDVSSTGWIGGELGVA